MASSLSDKLIGLQLISLRVVCFCPIFLIIVYLVSKVYPTYLFVVLSVTFVHHFARQVEVLSDFAGSDTQPTVPLVLSSVFLAHWTLSSYCWNLEVCLYGFLTDKYLIHAFDFSLCSPYPSFDYPERIQLRNPMVPLELHIIYNIFIDTLLVPSDTCLAEDYGSTYERTEILGN